MKAIFSILFFVTFAFGADATIDVIKTIKNKPSILVQANSEDVAKIAKILRADLNISTHFDVAQSDLINKVFSMDNVEATFYNLNSNLFVFLTSNSNEMQLYMYDIGARKKIFEKAYRLDDVERYPFVAHNMAIDINNYIKAPSIDFMNRYVVLSIMRGAGRSDIVISDYTLTYKKTIVSGGLNIFPKWANKEQSAIYYTKFLQKPTIFKYDLASEFSEVIIDSNGMAVVSDVSKDGKQLLLTLAPVAQTDIFLFNVKDKKLRQMTTYNGIDVSGKFIEKDKAMAFVSNRLGYPNIFKKQLKENASVDQLVFQGKDNSSLATYNDYIVFSSRESNNEFSANTFNLYMISVKSDYLRQLSATGINQMPKFSPDGQSLMFVKELSNQSALGIIRINQNKNFFFPLSGTKIQSFDW